MIMRKKRWWLLYEVLVLSSCNRDLRVSLAGSTAVLFRVETDRVVTCCMWVQVLLTRCLCVLRLFVRYVWTTVARLVLALVLCGVSTGDGVVT